MDRDRLAFGDGGTDAGAWVGAELVEVRATLGQDGGVWYPIRQGVRGLLVGSEAWLIVEAASHWNDPL